MQKGLFEEKQNWAKKNDAQRRGKGFRRARVQGGIYHGGIAQKKKEESPITREHIEKFGDRGIAVRDMEGGKSNPLRDLKKPLGRRRAGISAVKLRSRQKGKKRKNGAAVSSRRRPGKRHEVSLALMIPWGGPVGEKEKENVQLRKGGWAVRKIESRGAVEDQRRKNGAILKGRDKRIFGKGATSGGRGRQRGRKRRSRE